MINSTLIPTVVEESTTGSAGWEKAGPLKDSRVNIIIYSTVKGTLIGIDLGNMFSLKKPAPFSLVKPEFQRANRD